MRAAYAGHSAVVKLLLDAGATSELQDADGQTALHKAMQQGHVEIAGILLQRVPDRTEFENIKDNKGRLARDLIPIAT